MSLSQLVCFVWLSIINVNKIRGTETPLFNASYSPIIGHLPCNSWTNGSTNDNNFKVYWSFYLNDSVHAVEIDSCSSKYNTKLWLYHYDASSTGWYTRKTCDNCYPNDCYPNEFWSWHLDNTLDAGYYYLGIGGYQDLTGEYNVFLSCYTIDTLYISKYGTDSADCGTRSDKACATLYYGSQLINSDYVELHVIDGQNETEIRKYENINACVPDVAIDYIFYIYFDPLYIHSMSDWYYPDICNKSSNVTENRYLFQHSKDLRFRNLVIDDYRFMDQGLISTNANMQCYNCTFRNITFESNKIDEFDIIYVGLKSFFEDCVFSVITILNPSVFVHSELKIVFDHNIVSQINARSNFMVAEIYSNSEIADSLFDTIEIEDGSLFLVILGVDTKKWKITDCVFTNINLGSILTSIDNTVVLNIYMTNVNITTSQLYNADNDLNSLFYFSPSDVVNIQNIIVNYEYDLMQNCQAMELDEDQVQYGYILVSCANPISLFWSLATLTVEDMFLANGINNQTVYNYNEYILNKLNYSSNITVNYQYETTQQRGLIFISGSFSVYNLMVDTVTFHDKMIYLYYPKTIFIDGINTNYYTKYCNQGIECSIFDPNTLISHTWIHINGGKDESITVNITNSRISHTSFYGIWSYERSYTLRLFVYNSTVSDTMMAVWCRFGAMLGISSINFLRIGRVYSDTYHYYYRPENFEGFMTINIYHYNDYYIESSNFSHYNPDGFIFFFHNHKPAAIKDNHFELNMDNILYADQINNYPLKALISQYDSTVYYTNNYFGANPIKPSIPWILCVLHNGNCLSGNTFHGYGLRVEDCNITSCYRPNLIDCLHEDMCCDDTNYGAIDSAYNQTGKFILNDSNVEPFTVESYGNLGVVNVVIDNVEFEIYDNRSAISLVYDGNILITDSYTNIERDFVYASDECDVVCNELYSYSADIITETSIKCGTNLDTKEWNDYLLTPSLLSSSIEYNGTKYVDCLSASHLVLQTSGTYFAGGFLQIDFEITDKLGNIIDKKKYNRDLQINLESQELSYADQLYIINGSCDRCVNGIYLPSITLADSGQQFVINTAVTDSILYVNDIWIEVISCPSGYGSNANGMQCVKCAEGQFNLVDNECYSCDEQNNNGIKCEGGNEISIVKDYWIAVRNITNITITLDDSANIFGERQIITANCPFGYCCNGNDDQRCDYHNNIFNFSAANNLCARYHDYNTPLCGSCAAGYSVSMNSLQCIKCDTTHTYWIIYPLILALVLSLYLLGSKAETANQQKTLKTDRRETQKSSVTSSYLLTLIKIIMFKIILYYEQALVQILDASSIHVAMSAFASFFNVSVEAFSNDEDESSQICFIPELTLKGKILSGFVTIITIIFILGIMSIVSFLFPQLLVCGNMKPNFRKTFVSMLLLCIGKILSIIFKLLSCQTIGAEQSLTVHYYFGNEQCYGATYYLALAALIFIILLFGVLFIVLINMDVAKRQSDHLLISLTQSYKVQYYCWEFIIFLRRVFIAFFAISFDDNHAKFILFVGLIFFMLCQYYYQPFVVPQANEMELLLLICLILVVFTNVIYSNDRYSMIASVILSVLIVLPFILLLLYIVIYAIKTKKSAKEKEMAMLPFNSSSSNQIRQRVKYLMLCIVVWYSSQMELQQTTDKVLTMGLKHLHRKVICKDDERDDEFGDERDDEGGDDGDDDVESVCL